MRIPHNKRPDGHRRLERRGYVIVKQAGHPRARTSGGYVYEHILVAERALGHYLAQPAQVHHFDRDPGNYVGGNLVICQDNAYHRLLHLRQTAFDACGHADWRKCGYCGEHDAVEHLVHHAPGKRTETLAHRACRLAYDRARYPRRKKVA